MPSARHVFGLRDKRKRPVLRVRVTTPRLLTQATSRSARQGTARARGSVVRNKKWHGDAHSRLDRAQCEQQTTSCVDRRARAGDQRPVRS
jgi:hypothetical protein